MEWSGEEEDDNGECLLLLLCEYFDLFDLLPFLCLRPRWLSWMRRPTGDQEVAGSTPPRSATFFRGD